MQNSEQMASSYIDEYQRVKDTVVEWIAVGADKSRENHEAS